MGDVTAPSGDAMLGGQAEGREFCPAGHGEPGAALKIVQAATFAERVAACGMVSSSAHADMLHDCHWSANGSDKWGARGLCQHAGPHLPEGRTGDRLGFSG